MDLTTLLRQPGGLLVPGAGSALEARLVDEAGFAALYLSGYATAAAGFGLPDIGLIARDEVAQTLTRVRAVTDLPVIVDADTGYGDAEAVSHTVRTLERLGASAVQIEDQVWPKRCGHMSGKTVEERDVAFRKVHAAVSARRSAGTLIVARTDARGPLGLEEAIVRARGFVERGADLVFVDAPGSAEELREIGAADLGVPLVVNVSEGGLTPVLSFDDFVGLGFSVVLYPSNGARVMARSLRTFFHALRRQGDSRGLEDQFLTLGELNEVVGLAAFESFGRAVLAEAGR
ncbi:isocitrate lyase/PEP mutase family protein [Jiangella endophytica]|uniref:isocitrate lyase/PEP mutase family protein n=1 Tax=Jiangella endophytica TaxID=1623398 RepID=UPI000E3568BF|nr:isocitrate lyase/phosphoenolpyruvate mutase family protein [Jiangella endophytica]